MTLRCFGIGGGSPEALIHVILQVRLSKYFATEFVLFISCWSDSFEAS